MLNSIRKVLGLKKKELFDTYILPNGSKLYVPKGENPVLTTTNISVKIKETK